MSLVEHAKRELIRAGLFDKDADYGGDIATAVMSLIEVFSRQGHSGMSASLTIHLFDKLANFKTLTPVTSDPEEWVDVSSYSGRPLWQNTRDSSYFSEDGGKTFKSLDDKKETIEGD